LDFITSIYLIMSNNENGHQTSLVDEIENAFQACIAVLTIPSSNQNNHIHDSDEIKTSVDQTIQRFLDSAKQMECAFLQKRLFLSSRKPEQLIAEDIADLKSEISRKDQVLQRYHEKIPHLQSILSDTQPPSGPQVPSNLQPAMPGGGMPPRGPPPGMMVGPGQIRQPVHGIGPGPQQIPHHGHAIGPGPQQHQNPGHPMQGQVGPPAHMMQQQNVHVGPQQAAMMGHNPQAVGPGGPMAGQMQGHPPFMAGQQGPPQQGNSNLQGPLAFLERTTSNIGMPEPRR
jgi:mediator of RNA polymerase II transcription subunit 28